MRPEAADIQRVADDHVRTIEQHRNDSAGNPKAEDEQGNDKPQADDDRLAPGHVAHARPIEHNQHQPGQHHGGKQPQREARLKRGEPRHVGPLGELLEAFRHRGSVWGRGRRRGAAVHRALPSGK